MEKEQTEIKNSKTIDKIILELKVLSVEESFKILDKAKRRVLSDSLV